MTDFLSAAKVGIENDMITASLSDTGSTVTAAKVYLWKDGNGKVDIEVTTTDTSHQYDIYAYQDTTTKLATTDATSHKATITGVEIPAGTTGVKFDMYVKDATTSGTTVTVKVTAYDTKYIKYLPVMKIGYGPSFLIFAKDVLYPADGIELKQVAKPSMIDKLEYKGTITGSYLDDNNKLIMYTTGTTQIVTNTRISFKIGVTAATL